MPYFEIDAHHVRELRDQLGTKGYKVIADGAHTRHHTISKLIRELNSIVGNPDIYRNMLGELTFDFDRE